MGGKGVVGGGETEKSSVGRLRCLGFVGARDAPLCAVCIRAESSLIKAGAPQDARWSVQVRWIVLETAYVLPGPGLG